MFKKLQIIILGSVLGLCLTTEKLNAQFPPFPWVDVNFDNYAGTPASVNPQIYISWNSVSPASFYTSAGNFGISAPAYKFGNDSDYITTFYVPQMDSISFWLKGNGGPFSPLNELRFYVSIDSINYSLITSIDSLPTTGTNISIPLNQIVGYIRIEYRKLGGGNLAFDDLKIYSTTVIGLNEKPGEDLLTVYPMPATDHIYLKFDSKLNSPQIEIFDMLGNVISNATVQKEKPGLYKVDLSRYRNGFYFVKIQSDGKLFTKRITIQK